MKKPKPKDNQLRMCYGKLPYQNPDICYVWGDGCQKSDSRLLHYTFNHSLCGEKTLLEELSERGYDITTIEFKIMKKEK